MSKEKLLNIKDKLIILKMLNKGKIEYINGYMDAKLEKKKRN